MALGLPDRDGAQGDPTSAPPPWFGDPLPSQSPDVSVAPWGGHGAPARRGPRASARTDTVTRGSSSSDGPDALRAELRPPSAQGQKGSDPFPHHIPFSTAGSLLGACRARGTGWKNHGELRALAVSSAQSEFCPRLHLPALPSHTLLQTQHGSHGTKHSSFRRGGCGRKAEQALPGQLGRGRFAQGSDLLPSSSPVILRARLVPCLVPKGRMSHSRGTRRLQLPVPKSRPSPRCTAAVGSTQSPGWALEPPSLGRAPRAQTWVWSSVWHRDSGSRRGSA